MATTKAKRLMHQYSSKSMQDALNEIRRGKMSILSASVKYGVPRSTLQDRLHGRVADGVTRMGPPTILTNNEEELLVKWCQDLAKCGFPLKMDDLLNSAQAIIKTDKRPNPFSNNRPGRKWFVNFIKRHPSLKLREAEGINTRRAKITEQIIKKWFKELKQFLVERNALNILEDPSRIFNVDENSYCMCPATGKVLTPKVYRNLYSIQKGQENEMATVSVLLAFSANGKTVDPMLAFPFVPTPNDIANSLPDGWFLGKSETGWITCDMLFEYIAEVHNWLNNNNVTRPIILFLDGHKAHMTLNLSQFCNTNQIILYALPPNAAHIMQPADVSVFEPIKLDWKRTVREWQTQTPNSNKVLTKSNFCDFLHWVLSDIDMADTIRQSFWKCGLYPFSADNVDYTKCIRNLEEEPQELAKDEEEAVKSFSPADVNNAIEIINLIRTQLLKRGIDPDTVIEEICALKELKYSQDMKESEDVVKSETFEFISLN